MPGLKDVQFFLHALGTTVREYNLENTIYTQQIQQCGIKTLCVQLRQEKKPYFYTWI